MLLKHQTYTLYVDLYVVPAEGEGVYLCRERRSRLLYINYKIYYKIVQLHDNFNLYQIVSFSKNKRLCRLWQITDERPHLTFSNHLMSYLAQLQTTLYI